MRSVPEDNKPLTPQEVNSRVGLAFSFALHLAFCDHTDPLFQGKVMTDLTGKRALVTGLDAELT